MRKSRVRLARTISDAEHGDETLLFPSGTAALCAAILASVADKRKILLPRNCYPPILNVMAQLKRAAQIEYQVFDLNQEGDLLKQIDDLTAAVLIETFVSWTCEATDVAKIASICNLAGVRLIVDNTAATPLLFNPVDIGADLVVHSLAKYISDGSAIGGAIVAASSCAAEVVDSTNKIGLCFEEFPDSVAEDILSAWATLPQRVKKTQTNTRLLLPQLWELPDLRKCFHPLASNENTLISTDHFASLIGLQFTSPRLATQRAIEACSSIELGFGWGGRKTRLLLLPKRYQCARPEFSDGAMARLYVGHDEIDGVMDELYELLA